MIVDASAIVSILRTEPTAESVEAALENGTVLLMASVTLAEVVLVGLKHGIDAESARTKVQILGIEIVPIDNTLAIAAAEARHRFPIRFGDAFVVALAKVRAMPVLTLDAEFAKTDVALVPLA